MSEAYTHLADWFEFLNDDCDYPRWSQYFIDGLARLHAGRRGLELGCGSGAFTRALVKAGYSMTGADISPAMLQKAEALARAEGIRAEFVLQDAATLRAPAPFDFILAPNDCYNYLPPSRLLGAFRHAASCLVRGGLLWLDVSTPRKLRTQVANNTMVDDRDEVTYLSFNRLEEGRVETDVTLFVRERGETYRREDEHHTQYIHEKESILTALEGAGFGQIFVEGHLGEDPENSDRWNFLCVKQAQSTKH